MTYENNKTLTHKCHERDAPGSKGCLPATSHAKEEFARGKVTGVLKRN